MFCECAGLPHQHGSIGENAISVTTAQQPADRLPRGLALDVPHGYVNPTDGVGDSSAPTHPERETGRLGGTPRVERYSSAGREVIGKTVGFKYWRPFRHCPVNPFDCESHIRCITVLLEHGIVTTHRKTFR